VVDIQHRGLRPLEQDAAAATACLVEDAPAGIGIRQDLRRNRVQRGEQFAAIDLGRIEPAQQRVVVQQQVVHPLFERLRIGEVADPDGAAADLVFICGADAAPGRAELAVAAARLAGAVERAMRRQDQRGIVGELQGLRGDVEPLLAHRLDLGEQRPGIDDDAVADDRQLARPHDARRQQAQLVFDIPDNQRVAGVVTALEANHDIGALGQPVDDLALAFVAPLGADHGDIAHPLSSRR
jgi:hypothetical protein